MRDIHEVAAETAEKAKRHQEDGFARWIQSPLTKVVLSLIPPHPDHPEAVVMALRAAFDAGFDTGAIGSYRGRIAGI